MLSQTTIQCLELKTVSLAELEKYRESIQLRVEEELYDERLEESLDKYGLITPIVVDEKGNIIDGARVVFTLLKRKYTPAEKKAIKVPVLVVKCNETELDAQTLRFVTHILQKPITSVDDCKNKMLATLMAKKRFSLADSCPVCIAAFYLDAKGINVPGLQDVVEGCLKILYTYFMKVKEDVAEIIAETEKIKSKLAKLNVELHPKVAEITKSVMEVKPKEPSVVIAEEPKEETKVPHEEKKEVKVVVSVGPQQVPPAQQQVQPQPTTVAQQEQPVPQSIPQPSTEETKAIPESVSVSKVVAIRNFLDKNKEEIENIRKRKVKLYEELISTGMPKLIAEGLVFFLDRDEIENVIEIYRAKSRRGEGEKAVEDLIDMLDNLIAGEVNKITVDSVTYTRIREMSLILGVPIPLFLRKIIEAVYFFYLDEQVRTYDDLMRRLSQRP